VTDEALFYRRFIEDVRRCAAGRAPAHVSELERRIRIALSAPPNEREGSWARVVAGVAELLTWCESGHGSASRLRAFLRENADLDRPRDVAISDFHIVGRPEGVLTAGLRRYLVFAPILAAGAAGPVTLDEIVPAPARRLAEWAVYSLCGGAAAAALWFAFVVPV
jgi:hypothetical protein